MTRNLRSARYGAVLTFVLSGLMVGTMTVRIPALTDKLGLSESTVGAILLVWGLGALVTMQSMRRIMTRAGSRGSCGSAAHSPRSASWPWPSPRISRGSWPPWRCSAWGSAWSTSP